MTAEFCCFVSFTGCQEVCWEQEDHVMLWTSGKHTICWWIVRESPSLKCTHCATAAYLSVKTFITCMNPWSLLIVVFLLSSSWSLVLSNGLLRAEHQFRQFHCISDVRSLKQIYQWLILLVCVIISLKNLWDHGFWPLLLVVPPLDSRGRQ